MDLFGFQLKRKEQEQASFVPKQDDEGAVLVAGGGGAYGTFIDLDGTVRNEAELINKYRDMSNYPEVDYAIDDIVNEIIVQEAESKVVEIVLDDAPYTDKFKKLVINEFENVLNLLEFNQLAYDIARKWYVDGRLYYHVIIDEKSPSDGIKELRYIDPRKIRKIKQVKKKKLASDTPIIQPDQEFYLFNDKGFAKTQGASVSPSQTTGGLKIAKDSIVYCTSGLTSENGDMVLSYLHKAIRPLNQLRSMEDSLVIYRISRAPERRVFYIDVGNLPKAKAEQYVSGLMTKFKNKLTYDAQTGEIKDNRRIMTMLEDFWLPRREGGKGTEITTLPGGQTLGQLDDVLYFQKKLNKSLNVPSSRLDPDDQFNFGRATEISRDEVKFAKFIAKIRNKFSTLFTKILEKNLILKGIITSEEWDEFKNTLKYKFARDNHWDELMESEIMRDRLATIQQMQPFLGTMFSYEWARKHVLKQTDEEFEEIDKQNEEEWKNPLLHPPEIDPNIPQDPSQEQQTI